MNDDKLIKGLIIIAAGGITLRALKQIRYYKLQKELYNSIAEDKENE